MNPPRKRKRLIRGVGIGALILLLVWWIPLRRVYFEDGMRVSLKGGWTDGAVTFIVEGFQGIPAHGINVHVETTSGMSGYGTTDSHGIVVIPEHETEIVAVWIDGTYCEFLKIPLIDHVFPPDCASGLTVEAKLDRQP